MTISSANDCFPVTPNDDEDLAVPLRGIAFGTAGALRITTPKGNVQTIPSGVLSAGLIHPVMAVRIHATGTTAGDIWGFE